MERLGQHHRNGNIWVGLVIVLIGTGLLINQMDLAIPDWVISWKTLLIALGIIVGIRSEFRSPSWFIMILVGGIFLIEDLIPGLVWHHYTWPLLLIIFGLFMILRPRKNRWRNWQDWNQSGTTVTNSEEVTNEDFLDYTTFFGSLQKNILTKDFKGGDIVTVFGGTELNFVQADINGKVILDVTSIFGGTKLIVPSHWEIKSELTSIFGGIEDKRPVQPSIVNNKILILKGTTVFGGIEIVSY